MSVRLVDKTSKGRYIEVGSTKSGQTPSPVFKTIVQNIDLKCVRPSRAGVIMYTVFNGSTYFGLGLDSRTHDLTDFGGGVVYRTDGDAICGALREFDEEILRTIKPMTPEDVKSYPVIYDDNNLIIFAHVNVDPEEMCKLFNQRYALAIKDNQELRLQQQEPTNLQNKSASSKGAHKINKKIRDPEVCGITWLTWEEFRYIIKEKGPMFSRVQKFLFRAGDFSYLL
ncbi:Hypothetical protein HVR_LOCUS1221 [uncultured virus]|nr:Hypothetical protein HVR_LOCUS1221 [uncultured virus]